MNKTFRRLFKLYLVAGVLFIVLGIGQFFFFLGLDELGLIEVGNALGLALLVWLAVAVGFIFLLLAFLLAALSAGDSAPRPLPGGPFDWRR